MAESLRGPAFMVARANSGPSPGREVSVRPDLAALALYPVLAGMTDATTAAEPAAIPADLPADSFSVAARHTIDLAAVCVSVTSEGSLTKAV
ncbi:MAG: hypothetical protein EBX36_12375, partial [Planctomycetia bacterium]|nr:hypothetical protein [Planctomycetia bacterium]